MVIDGWLALSVALLVCLDREDRSAPPALRLNRLEECFKKLVVAAKKQDGPSLLPRLLRFIWHH